jgi:hypothetical protein
MKVFSHVSRIFAGLVFVFSGFVKAVDPSGSAIKFREYFEAFHMDFLAGLAMPLAILLSGAELMIGLNLLGRVRMKFTAWLLLIFMAFFTVLTFILAIANPVSDCGCFGDALKLTNWQTFGKNVILFVPTLVVFVNRKRFTPVASCLSEWVLASLNLIIAVGISVFCILHQPLLDFRPYRVGTWIPGQMTVPEGAPVDVYETVLVYEKGGNRQEFTDKNFPWQDTTWKWVETRQKLLKKGYTPPIHDFSITNSEGTDITDTVLSDQGYVFLIISPNLTRASMTGFESLKPMALRARELGFTVYGLTASSGDQVAAFRQRTGTPYPFCTADETTLKTIIRANPGVLLLHEGTVIGKWNYRDAPEASTLRPDLLSVVMLDHERRGNTLVTVMLGLACALCYGLFFKSLSLFCKKKE